MLMHPEYQINNKNISRNVLSNVEIYKEVAKEQHGPRKHHQAGLLEHRRFLRQADHKSGRNSITNADHMHGSVLY